MYAGPDCCRFALFVEIVATVSDEGPGMAIGHHVSPKVSAIHMANREVTSTRITVARALGHWSIGPSGAFPCASKTRLRRSTL